MKSFNNLSLSCILISDITLIPALSMVNSFVVTTGTSFVLSCLQWLSFIIKELADVPHVGF